MSSKTADEVLQGYVSQLGEKAGRYFRAVENDLYNLRIEFEIYRSLFGTNKERVDLLNSCSGITAFYISRSLADSVLLRICRLTDPEKMRGKRNVTINGLPSLLRGGSDQELDERLAFARNFSSFARDWRNRRIAHSDEEVRVFNAKLEASSRDVMANAIDAIAACVRRFAAVELGVSLMTHPIRALDKDEVHFLEVLYLGMAELEKASRLATEARARKDWTFIDNRDSLPDWLTYRPDHAFDSE